MGGNALPNAPTAADAFAGQAQEPTGSSLSMAMCSLGPRPSRILRCTYPGSSAQTKQRAHACIPRRLPPRGGTPDDTTVHPVSTAPRAHTPRRRWPRHAQPLAMTEPYANALQRDARDPTAHTTRCAPGHTHQSRRARTTACERIRLEPKWLLRWVLHVLYKLTVHTIALHFSCFHCHNTCRGGKALVNATIAAAASQAKRSNRPEVS